MLGFLLFMNQMLSVIIPTWNEEGNIRLLVKKISDVLTKENTTFELVFVDDHSTDKTVTVIKEMARTYPIRIFSKKGARGKAQSLIEGFQYAKGSILCMIDADLQYPPSAIPAMLKKLERGADIVVAERKKSHISLKRKITSKGFHFVFSQLLHRLNLDTQSGLKVFRKEVIDSLELGSKQWAFDMEFLIKAKKTGWSISSLPIEFHERHSGKAKINIVTASFQLAWSSLLLKFISDVPLLYTKMIRKQPTRAIRYKNNDFVTHSSLPTNESALYSITRQQKFFVFLFAFIFLIGIFFAWHTTLFLFVVAITTLYFMDLLFNLFLIYRSFSKSPEISISDEEIAAESKREWPLYTIYCPLYKEWNVVPQFISAINSLDYPKNKLQVLLLLEEDDKETIKHIRKYQLPSFMEIVVVPNSMPKTKPKAMNYGLTKTRGEFVVVYDAEDIPDPKQLKKALLAFEKAGDKTVCIQAKLNFYNPYQNILTRVFTAEYSLWFDLVLTGLQSIKAPIPLGGTSNHFRTKDIRSLQGWDAFNVTEDCDLGTRLAKQGYQTAIVDSTTLEEANSDLKNWYNQRSRWIKGYIQTYFVHMRNPGTFFGNKKSHLLTFQLVVGAKIFSLFVNPFMWLSTISYFAFRPFIGATIESFFPAPVLYMAVFSLIVGNFLYVYYYMLGLAKRGYDEIIPFVFVVPFYWLAMSFASWKALYEFIRKPHYWAKTKHGLHLSNEKAMNHATSAVGRKLVDRKFAVYPIDITPAFSQRLAEG